MPLPSNSGHRPANLNRNGGRHNGARVVQLPPSQLTDRTLGILREQLLRQPAVRPEVVARARKLAADPSYPSITILESVAAQILAAPDLSEEPVGGR